MADVSWIKLSVNMFNDEKIQLIESMPDGDALVMIWIKLLTLAGKSNQGGYCNVTCNVTYTDDMLSVLLKKPIDIVKKSLNIFEKFGMIECSNDGIYIVNWEKHQNTDALEKLRLQTRERVKRFRVKQSDINSSNVTDTLHVTQSNATDIDKNKNKNKNKNILKDKTLYLESVFLNDHEYASLIEKYQTEEKLKKGIEILNNYLQSSGKKYKSHYHVLIGWVLERVMENAKSKGIHATNFGTNRTAEEEKPRVSKFPTINYLPLSEMS